MERAGKNRRFVEDPLLDDVIVQACWAASSVPFKENFIPDPRANAFQMIAIALIRIKEFDAAEDVISKMIEGIDRYPGGRSGSGAIPYWSNGTDGVRKLRADAMQNLAIVLAKARLLERARGVASNIEIPDRKALAFAAIGAVSRDPEDFKIAEYEALREKKRGRINAYVYARSVIEDARAKAGNSEGTREENEEDNKENLESADKTSFHPHDLHDMKATLDAAQEFSDFQEKAYAFAKIAAVSMDSNDLKEARRVASQLFPLARSITMFAKIAALTRSSDDVNAVISKIQLLYLGREIINDWPFSIFAQLIEALGRKREGAL